MARYGRLDLVCLDELGYVQLDPRGSELLFQILTEREEKASVALASNLPFSEWAFVSSHAFLQRQSDRESVAIPLHRIFGALFAMGEGARGDPNQPPSAVRIAAKRVGSTRHHIQRPRFSPTRSPAWAKTVVWWDTVG